VKEKGVGRMWKLRQWVRMLGIYCCVRYYEGNEVMEYILDKLDKVIPRKLANKL